MERCGSDKFLLVYVDQAIAFESLVAGFGCILRTLLSAKGDTKTFDKNLLIPQSPIVGNRGSLLIVEVYAK